jgi:hypothetical protein
MTVVFEGMMVVRSEGESEWREREGSGTEDPNPMLAWLVLVETGDGEQEYKSATNVVQEIFRQHPLKLTFLFSRCCTLVPNLSEVPKAFSFIFSPLRLLLLLFCLAVALVVEPPSTG